MSETTLRVRDARPEDAATIAAFNQAMALETEHKRLDPELLEHGVRAALADPERAFYLVAERGSEVAGCLMVTREWSDWRNGFFWWIQSVYVAPAQRRQGVFGALYRALQSRAEADSTVCGLRLYVETLNRPAQATYRALGMEPAGYLVYQDLFR